VRFRFCGIVSFLEKEDGFTLMKFFGVRFLSLLLSVCALSGLSSCSVYLAARQPSEKDLEVLTRGTPRGVVIAELGHPVASYLVNLRRVDYFKFKQGYSKGAKAARVLGHGAANAATLGLWDVAGTPTELYFDGADETIKVEYDARDRVVNVRGLEE